MSVIAGGFGRARAQSRLRAAVNARLEEISFRTGVITATIGLVALSVIAAAGVLAATLSFGSQAVATVGALGAAGTASTRPAAPKTTAPATPPAQPTTPARPPAAATPKAIQPVTAATTTSQPAAGSQHWRQADGSQAGTRYHGRPPFGGHGSWYGGSWYGGSWRGGSWYSGHGPWHGDPGFPGQRGFGRPFGRP